MKIEIIPVQKFFPSPLFILLLLLISAISLQACSTTGNQRSEKTTASITEVEKDISNVLTHINNTNNSLKKLTLAGQSNPSRNFKQYSGHTKKMSKSGKQLLEHTEKMSAQGKEYFAEWRNQDDGYTNPQIQSLSEQRRADSSTAFADISNSSVGLKGALRTYMTDIEEIQAYLSNDLTSAGIESIRPIANKAIVDGELLKDAIAPVSDALAFAKTALAQGTK